MDERVTFLGDADQEPFKNLLNKAFEVQGEYKRDYYNNSGG